MMDTHFASILLGILVLASMAGCSATTDDLQRELSRELKPGVSTLEDTLMVLGVPEQVYEDGRIIAYPGSCEDHSYGLLRPPHLPQPCRLRVDTEVFLTYDQHWVLTGWNFVKNP